MKNVKKLLNHKKNLSLILGIAVSLLILFQKNYSQSHLLLPKGVEISEIPNPPDRGIICGNLLTSNFLSAFFSSLHSKSCGKGMSNKLKDQFAPEKPWILEALSTSK